MKVFPRNALTSIIVLSCFRHIKRFVITPYLQYYASNALCILKMFSCVFSVQRTLRDTDDNGHPSFYNCILFFYVSLLSDTMCCVYPAVLMTLVTPHGIWRYLCLWLGYSCSSVYSKV